MNFQSIFEYGYVSTKDVVVCLAAALIAGVIFATLCMFKTKSTKSFLMATALMPMVVALVILLVNGNIGTGIAIAGAFSLVRFRSAPGTAKEISIIFVAMAAGLAFGMGYIVYGSAFLVGTGAIIIGLEWLKIWDRKPDFKDKRIKIVIPEDLDYTTVFDDIFEKYTERYDVMKVKTANMGSMFIVYYHIVMKDVKQEKEMIDEIRIRNGNLEVSVNRTDYTGSEL